MAAAEVAVAPRARMSALARNRDAPSRPASAEARMIAVRVADGLAVAAAADASGLQPSRDDHENDTRGPYGHAEKIT